MLRRLIVDHLKLLAPDKWDPLREALKSVGRSPSICSFLREKKDNYSDGLVSATSLLGQSEVALALAPEEEEGARSDHLKVQGDGFKLSTRGPSLIFLCVSDLHIAKD